MKIVLASSLYPPDIAEPAPYIKELAKRLSAWHEVTVVAYGTYPERIENVHIVAVDKHQPLPLRLLAFFFALARAAGDADAVIVENGASVELPASILARLIRTTFVLHIGDETAAVRTKEDKRLARIERFFAKRASCVLEDRPLPRPEILPFAEAPSSDAYEASWKEHLGKLKACVHA